MSGISRKNSISDNAIETKSLFTEAGLEVPYHTPTVDYYLDKTTFIFGRSFSGKTTMIEEIMHICRNHIPNYLIIAPSTSQDAYKHKLPLRCIKEDLTQSKLEKIWNRQSELTKIYKQVNNVDNLREIFNMIKDNPYKALINALDLTVNNYIKNIENNRNLHFTQKRKYTELIESKKNERSILIFKTMIRKNKMSLLKMNLSLEQQAVVEYLDLNPRMMLIFDDCTEKFPNWTKKSKKQNDSVFNSILFRGRHNFITLIVTAHDDKFIPPELRKNARTVKFGDSSSLIAYINKNAYTNEERKNAEKISKLIFGDNDDTNSKNYQKVCHIRDAKIPFQYTIANIYPDVKMGSKTLWSLSEKMPCNNDTLNNNPFIKNLKKRSNYNTVPF